MSLKDRNGAPFTGTPEELKRHNAKLRKQASRAAADPVLALPLPPGLARALDRVCGAGGFDDQREAISQLILGADKMLTSDRAQFDKLTNVTVTIGNLDKWLPLIGVEPENTEENE